ncbi:unnamed protein product [Mytilus coruscus]|uniref:Mitochondria-eating protein C-terminal domain-containing protein n=1 Tax=Mytilus coruscus TaxID=42192 RepID=A0A6J8D4E5_MYTCO|nr:unnamed protein product [Mytilus coruscus]
MINRPTKLEYMSMELYDNEWTDAFKKLYAGDGEEKSAITTLRNIVEKSYDFAKGKSEKYSNGLECAFLAIESSIESFLRSHTEFSVGGTDVETFIKKTLSLCWLMNIVDPPAILITESSGKFNTDLFKFYTKSGSKVDYVVWPAVFLHEGGPLICKGVAQGK